MINRFKLQISKHVSRCKVFDTNKRHSSFKGYKPAPFRGGISVAPWECAAFPWGIKDASIKEAP